MQTLELFAFEGAPSLGSPQPNMEPDEILSAVCYIVQRSAAAARARPGGPQFRGNGHVACYAAAICGAGS